MSVDISKIKPGDKITVEFTVTTNNAFEDYHCIATEDSKGVRYKVLAGDVIGHTPAPRPIKVGDMVHYRGGSASWVKAVDGGYAWINFGVVRVDELEHVDET